jgi:hypothetical protein
MGLFDKLLGGLKRKDKLQSEQDFLVNYFLGKELGKGIGNFL